jgi:hypothetical protein
MTLDLSLEAIEADLMMAERGGQVATLALARAQVRATLLAAAPADHQGRHEAEPYGAIVGAPAGDVAHSPDIVVSQGADVDVFTVPKSSPWADRVTAAAMLLGVDAPLLALRLHDADGTWEDRAEVAAMLLDPSVVPDEDVLAAPPEDDELDDVFAEARKAKKGRKK